MRSVFTSRCANAVDASTFLCCRYRHSDRSIFGLVLDRRERSEAFIDIMRTLDTNTGLPLLPALAMALFALRVNIRILAILEESYFLQKVLDRVQFEIGSGSSRPAHFDGLVQVLGTMFNSLYGIVGSLKVSLSAMLALTELLREKDPGKQFSYFVDAIDPETRGHIEAAARTQARIGQRHDIFTAAMQTTIVLQSRDAKLANTKQAEILIATRKAAAASTETLKTMVTLLQQSQEATAKQAEVLVAGQEATAASTKTLSTMVLLLKPSHEANIKQADVLVATQKATLASTDTLGTMQELLAGTQELNRKAEEVARKLTEDVLVVWDVALFLLSFNHTLLAVF
jgi:hypothetical protein